MIFFRLVLAALQEEWNHYYQKPSKNWVKLVHHFTLIKYFWKLKETEKKVKQQEEESLYKVM